MAYRRLPNTDNARLIAILRLKEMLNRDASVLVNRQKKITDFKMSFEKLIETRDTYKTNRSLLNKQKKEMLGILKVYVSHFLQVFNFAIDRGEIEKEARSFFKLTINTGVIPSLSKETEIIEWAYNIVEGEEKRVVKGAEFISHPKSSQIKIITVATEKLMNDLQIMEQLFEGHKIELAKQRIEIDLFIKQVWNEIEFQFINEPIEIKRKKAAQYGVVYVK